MGCVCLSVCVVHYAHRTHYHQTEMCTTVVYQLCSGKFRCRSGAAPPCWGSEIGFVRIQRVVLIQLNAAPRAIALTVPMSACVLLLSDLRCSGGCNRPPTQGS